MYDDVLRALVETLEGVPNVRAVFDYEPRQIDAAPAIYTLIDSQRRNDIGGRAVAVYRVLVRTLVRWQDNEYAEREIREYVNSVPMAIDANPGLSGKLTSGTAKVERDTDHPFGFVKVGGVEYRCMDLYVRIVEKDGRGNL